MKKNVLALTLLAASISSTVNAADFTPQKQSEKPNIVLIMAEDLSPRWGAYGDSVAKTPNIDALAKESVRFQQVYAMAPVSAPSRAGVITGRFPQTLGLQHMRTTNYPGGGYIGVPESQVKGYPELLRANGYFTYNDTKTDYQFSGGPMNIGPFTLWDQHGSYKNMDDFMAPIAWRNYDLHGKPFFLHLNPQITHESGIFRKEDLLDKKWERLVNRWDKLRAHYNIQLTDPKDIKLEPYYPDTPRVRRDIARHYDNVQVMDQMVGKIVQGLKKDGLWDNTILIVTTDHGDGIPRHKRDLYDSGLKVPFMVHVPKQYRPLWWKQNGQTESRLVSFEDLAPTILGFSGSQVPDYMTGVDLSKDNATVREYVYAGRDRFDSVPQYGRSVRNARYSYVYNEHTEIPGGYDNNFRNNLGIMQSMKAENEAGHLNKQQKIWFEPRPQEELYDKVNDPYELNNLAQDPKYKAVLETMRQALVAWDGSAVDMSLMPESEMVKQILDKDGKQRVTEAPFGHYNSLFKTFSIVNRTQNASIGYRFDDGDWLLYTKALKVPQGVHKIEFKSVRYGWKESENQSYTFQ
ncbi:sulfatase [Vibrio gazogenes]|uniref:Arylsulfatase A n=1 Tax=Vibrio gazogenes DSM 21264 = NBRC 103151 TaxID=1123492 RepID=A0A1M5AAM3_VIBGA|nr:sulfatase [Vibrio gazogenes]USP13289.1 sulfatase [Vibrio gazogenes]SHF27225.1 Arylsulfatase A [Vibrio gazogenes DSM 21264] [Vibrio gazogenes DSM 21264 = NBRC 103151]